MMHPENMSVDVMLTAIETVGTWGQRRWRLSHEKAKDEHMRIKCKLEQLCLDK